MSTSTDQFSKSINDHAQKSEQHQQVMTKSAKAMRDIKTISEKRDKAELKRKIVAEKLETAQVKRSNFIVRGYKATKNSLKTIAARLLLTRKRTQELNHQTEKLSLSQRMAALKARTWTKATEAAQVPMKAMTHISNNLNAVFGQLGVTLPALGFVGVVGGILRAVEGAREWAKSYLQLHQASNMVRGETIAAQRATDRYTFYLSANREEVAALTAQNIATARQLGLTGKAFGEFVDESVKYSIEFSKATGMSTSEAGSFYRQMTRIYEMKPSEIRKFGNAFKFIADRTGVSKQELQSYASSLDGLLLKMGGMTGAQKKNFVAGMTAVQGQMKRFGLDASQFGEMFTDAMSIDPEKSAVALQKLQRLLGDNLSMDQIKGMIGSGQVPKLMDEIVKSVQKVQKSGGMQGLYQYFKDVGGLTEDQLLRLGKIPPEFNKLYKEAISKQKELNKTTKRNIKTFREMIEQAFTRISKKVGAVFGEDLNHFVNKTILGKGGLIESLGKLLSAFKKLTFFGTKIKTRYKLLGLALIFLIGPATILTGLFKGFIGTLKLVGKSIRPMFKLLTKFGGVLTFLTKAGFKGGLLKFFATIGTKIPLIGWIISGLLNLPKLIRGILKDFKSMSFGRFIGALVGRLSGFAIDVINDLFLGIPGWIVKKLTGFDIGSIGETLSKLFSDAVKDLPGTFLKVGSSIMEFMMKGVKNLGPNLKSLFTSLGKMAYVVYDWTIGENGYITKFFRGVNNVFDAVKKKLGPGLLEFGGFVKRLGSALANGIKLAFTGMAKVIQVGGSALLGLLSSILGRVKGAFKFLGGLVTGAYNKVFGKKKIAAKTREEKQAILGKVYSYDPNKAIEVKDSQTHLLLADILKINQLSLAALNMIAAKATPGFNQLSPILNVQTDPELKRMMKATGGSGSIGGR